MASMPFSPCDPTVANACQDETSLNFLRHVFGGAIDRLLTGVEPIADGNILASMLGFFNSGILVIGAIIASYTAVMGVVNTANDGEVLGKNWSSTWTPVRIVAGAGALLPTASGYSFIQIIVLMIALWSVGFANGVYRTGLAMGILSPDGLVQGVYEPGTTYGFRDFAKSYVVASYCMRAADEIYFNPAAQPVSAQRPQVRWQNRQDQASPNGRSSTTFEARDVNAYTNLAGSYGQAGTPLCGSWTEEAPGWTGSTDPLIAELDALDNQISGAKSYGLWQLRLKIDDWVRTWPPSLEHGGWQNVSATRFNDILKEVEDSVANQLAAQSTSSVGSALNNLMTNLTRPGWAEAAGWFQRAGMVRQRITAILERPPGTSQPPQLTGLPDDSRRERFLAAVQSAPQQILQRAANTWRPPSQREITTSELTATLPTDPTSAFSPSAISQELDTKMSTFLGRWMESLVEVATGANSDGTESELCRTDFGSGTRPALGGSVMRMKCVGDTLTVIYGSLWTFDNVVKTTVTGVRVAAGVASSVKVVGSGADLDKVATPLWDWVIQVFSPAIAEVLKYLRPIAFYFGVLLPAMPYIIFMVVVVGWVLAILQAMLATPLWMLMHMRPDRTFIGSEKQGYLLLLGLFARPALAVVGLFAALLVVDPVIDYSAKGFFALRGAIVASTGTLGFIAEFVSFLWWLTVFGLMLLPMMYMTFGLAQALPDHVLRWLNAGTPDLGESGATNKVLTATAATAALPGSVVSGRLGRQGRGNPGNRALPAPEGGGGGGGQPGGPSSGAPGGGGNGTSPGSGRRKDGAAPLLGYQGVNPNTERDIAPAASQASTQKRSDQTAPAAQDNAASASGALAGGQGAVSQRGRDPGSRAEPPGPFGRFDSIGTAPPVAPHTPDRVPAAGAPGGPRASQSARGVPTGSVMVGTGSAGGSTMREKQAAAEMDAPAPATPASAPPARSAGGDLHQRARQTQRDQSAAAALEAGGTAEGRPARVDNKLPVEASARQDRSVAPSERPAPHVLEQPSGSGDQPINQGPQASIDDRRSPEDDA